MKNFILNILLVLVIQNATAQVFIDDAFVSSTLENKMSIFKDSTNSLKIEDILNTKESLPFKVFEDPSPNLGYDSSNFWIHFKVKNITPKKLEFFIKIYRIAPDKSFFYLCQNKAVLDSNKFDWKEPMYLRQTQSKMIASKFSIEAGKEYDIYYLHQSRWNLVNLGIEIWSKRDFLISENFENIIYGILIGGMLLAVCMAVYLGFESMEKVYFYYSAYSMCSVLSILSLGGILTQLFGYHFRIFTGPESYFLYFLGTIAFNILFTHHFLEINQKGPKWLYNMGKFIVFLCGLLAFIIIYDYKIIERVRFINLYLVFTPTFIISVLFSIVRKEILGKLYMLAFLPLFVLMILIIASEAKIINTPILLPYITLGIFFELIVLLIGLAYRLYNFKREKQKLESELVFLNIQTQEIERKRLAQDLHDDLGGTLSAIKGKVANEIQNPETLYLVEKAIEDLRSISRNLLPPELAKNGLSKAIQQSIERLQSSTTIGFTFITFGIEKRMSEERELNIYRVVSELLNNTVKHSKASKATIQVIFYDEYVHISVEDTGVGIKTEEKNWGIGLKNVNSRIEFLKAKLLKDSNENGTTFIIEVSYI